MKNNVTEKAVDLAAESAEVVLDNAGESAKFLTPKNVVIVAGVALLVTGVYFGVKAFRKRSGENDEEVQSEVEK